MSEKCWVIGDRQQTRQELVARLETRAKQMECCLEGNQCPLCSTSLLHNRHTIEDCLKDYVRQLTDTDQQAFPRNEVTWKIYEGDIEVTRVWNKPSLGLRKCELCDQRRPLCMGLNPLSMHHIKLRSGYNNLSSLHKPALGDTIVGHGAP